MVMDSWWTMVWLTLIWVVNYLVQLPRHTSAKFPSAKAELVTLSVL